MSASRPIPAVQILLMMPQKLSLGFDRMNFGDGL